MLYLRHSPRRNAAGGPHRGDCCPSPWRIALRPAAKRTLQIPSPPRHPLVIAKLHIQLITQTKAHV